MHDLCCRLCIMYKPNRCTEVVSLCVNVFITHIWTCPSSVLFMQVPYTLATKLWKFVESVFKAVRSTFCRKCWWAYCGSVVYRSVNVCHAVLNTVWRSVRFIQACCIVLLSRFGRIFRRVCHKIDCLLTEGCTRHCSAEDCSQLPQRTRQVRGKLVCMLLFSSVIPADKFQTRSFSCNMITAFLHSYHLSQQTFVLCRKMHSKITTTILFLDIVVRLSVVCEVRAPYSTDWNFR